MRYLVLCLGLLSSLLLCACDTSDQHAIRFGLAAAPVNLDPRQATDAASSRINRLLYQSLVDFDEQLRPVPSLADWQLLNPTLYQFTLKAAGRQFHDGRHLTAHDVKASYDWILDPEQASPLRSSLQLITDIKVIDDNTLQFQLSQPDLLFPSRLAVGIVPAEVEQPLSRHPIGSGAFRFVSWQTDNRLVLQRIHDGQEVVFLEVKDPVVRSLKLVHGELDLMQNDLSPELIRWLSEQEEVQISTRQGSNFAYLGFNLQDPLTRQLLVRQAIAHAIDRQAIVHYVMGDAARLANGLLPPHHWAGNANLSTYDYDPEQARRLLKRAGFDGKTPITLSYKTSNNPFRVRLASVIQQQLGEVGIEVNLQTYDWGTFYGDIKSGRFQMFSLAWVGVKTPDIFRYVFHSDAVPPNGANRGHLVDQSVDRFIDQAEHADTWDEQARLYQALQAYLHALLPYVPLWYEDHVLIQRQRLQGYQLAADGNYDGLLTATLLPAP